MVWRTKMLACGAPLLAVMLLLAASTGCKSRLAKAVERGDQGEVIYLLGTSYDGGGNLVHSASDPNEQISGKPLLTWAIEHGNKAVANALIHTLGTDTNATDRWGVTPLVAAAAQCDTETSITLLKYKADANVTVPRQKGGHTNPISTPLEGAVACHNWELFSALLAYGARPDAAAFAASLPGCNSVGYDPRYSITLTRDLEVIFAKLSAAEKSVFNGCRDVLIRAIDNKIQIDLVEPK